MPSAPLLTWGRVCSGPGRGGQGRAGQGRAGGWRELGSLETLMSFSITGSEPRHTNNLGSFHHLPWPKRFSFSTAYRCSWYFLKFCKGF